MESPHLIDGRTQLAVFYVNLDRNGTRKRGTGGHSEKVLENRNRQELVLSVQILPRLIVILGHRRRCCQV
jgi:hypothetical protein